MSKKFLKLSAVAVLCYVLGLLLFWAALPRHEGQFNVENQPQKGLVVFTGGSKRIDEAFRQLSTGFTGSVLISGVSSQVKESALLRRVPGQYHKQITLDYTADTTRMNVVALKRWSKLESIENVALVTSYYHMPRALLVLKQGGWTGKVQQVPVLPDYLPLSFLFREYNKYLLAYLRLI